MRSLGVIALCFAAGGCSNMIQKKGLDTTGDIMERARGGMEQESELWLVRLAMPSGIKMAEGFYIAHPRSKKIGLLVTAGFCGYAGFLEDDWDTAIMEKRFDDADAIAERGAKHFTRCVNYGVGLLGKRWKTDLYTTEAAVKKLLAKTGKSKAPALFWTAMGLAGSIGMMQGDVEVLAHLSKVELMLERVLELDEDYQDGMAHILLGSIQCGRSAALGGEIEKGRAHFEEADRINGGKLLIGKVLMARHCAVNSADRELFHSTLVEVLSTNPLQWPDQRLANAIAHHKARRYLKYEKDYFR